MAVDLTNAQRRASAKILLDRVTITRNPGGWTDDAFDDETGTYPEVAPRVSVDEEVLATDVPAKLSPVPRLSQITTDPGPRVIEEHDLALDVEAAPDGIRLGDRISVTSSDDPDLVGVDFFVVGIETSTLRIFRKLLVRRSFDGAHIS